MPRERYETRKLPLSLAGHFVQFIQDCWQGGATQHPPLEAHAAKKRDKEVGTMNDRSNRKQLFWHSCLVIGIAATVLFANLGQAKLWDRDEPRNAGCAEEMLSRGDLVTPIFNDELRGAKPVLLYWLIIAAYQMFGVNEFSARFFSALLGCGTVWLTYLNGRRIFNAQVGVFAAIVLSSSLMFVVAGRAATPDSTLMFSITLAISIFVHAYFPGQENATGVVGPALDHTPKNPFSSWRVSLLIYAAMGLAVLAKGPVGLILPTAIIGMFLLIERLDLPKSQQENSSPSITFTRRLARLASISLQPFQPWHFLKTCWAMRPITALVVVLLVAGPWYLLVGLRTNGDFLESFFLKEHFGRATTAMENHRGNVLFYPLAMMLGLFPWSVFTLPLLLVWRRNWLTNDRWRVGSLLMACWIIIWIGAFSLARTKLPSYITPCYPAAAILIGCFLQRWLERPTELASKFYLGAIGCLVAVGLALTIAAPIATSRFFAGEQWLLIIGLVPMFGGCLAFFFEWNQLPHRAVYTFAATAIVFCLLLFAIGTTTISKYQAAPQMLANVSHRSEKNDMQAAQQPPSVARIASYRCMESSWVFYSKFPITELAVTDQRIPLRQRTFNWQSKPKTDLHTFLQQPQSYLITTRSHWDEVRQRAGQKLEIVDEVPYFMKAETLLLIRPVAEIANADEGSNH
jgi:4-amino-4-deoxy-L-arabinose transferase-like glycosyltransferase